MLQELSVAAATAVVGYNLLEGKFYGELGYPRVLVAMGLKGSAAGGDTEVEIQVGTDRKANIFNTNTGLPNSDDIKPVGPVFIPAGMPFRLEVKDAPATNPINVLLVFAP